MDDYGDAAWIEGSDKTRLPADKLILAVRRDLTSSAAKLLRFAHLSRSVIIVGDGQGALTGLLLTKPSNSNKHTIDDTSILLLSFMLLYMPCSSLSMTTRRF